MSELVSIWIAEGFLVKPKNSKTVEEEADECFWELLSRSFFQKSNMNNSLFVMHDLFHDLSQYVMGDFCYRLEDGKLHGVAKKVRHFSFVRRTFRGFEDFKEIMNAKFLRTFLPLKRRDYFGVWLSEKVVNEILPKLTQLRLLSLSQYGIKKLPYSIGNLTHLRFLDLSRAQIRELPQSVCTLYNLETLLLFECNHLMTLPADLVKLISLRHLDLRGTNLKEMPMNIHRLKDLQQLTVFVVGKCSGINELREFYCLRGTISISGLQNIESVNDALEAKMSEKKHLEKLALEWDSTTEDDSQNAREVLEKLEPHRNLKHLEIKNYGGTRFPTWLGDPLFCNMVSLRLENCENCFSLPPLGQTPYLKELTIARMSGITIVGPEFYGDSGFLSKPFQSLETLRLEKMSEWVDWCKLDAAVFSRLQKLEVIECPKLIGCLPTNVPSLVRLEIVDCPELVASLPRTNSICWLVLKGCKGVRLEWTSVPSVEKLEISGFTNLKEFPSELVTLTNLKELSVQECPGLSVIPLHQGATPFSMFLEWPTLNSCESLKSLTGVSSVEKPEISGFASLKEFQRELIPQPKPSVDECLSLYVPLSEGISRCNTFLQRLTFNSCESLKSLPLGLFPKLRYLEIRDCKNFETMLIPCGVELQNLRVLESLAIRNCGNMLSFPCGGLRAPNLSFLGVSSCKKLKALPKQIHTLLPSLESLVLNDCPEIESFPEGGLPSKLGYLYISSCKKLLGGRRHWGLQTLPSLTTFSLWGGPEDQLESFPEKGLLPYTLTCLRFGDLLNLKSLDQRGLQLLVSLKRMHIFNCSQLQSLSVERLPTSLLELTICGCPLLKPRCHKEEGEDWHKIAHIPCIFVDGEVISE